MDFKEAVKRLSGNGYQKDTPPARKKPLKNKSPLTAKQIKLLNRVIEFYHTAFTEDNRAKEYLAKRGITENAVFSDYKTGFANGTLLNILPDDAIIQLKEIGILNEKGTEHFYGCVTFLCFDGDESGKKSAERLSETLHSKHIENTILPLPQDQDINEFFLLTANAKEKFINLIHPKNPEKEKKDGVVKTEYGFVMTSGPRAHMR